MIQLALIRDEACPMTNSEGLVWLVIRERRGRRHAIKQADLAERLGWRTGKGLPDTRRVQRTIKSLVKKHGKLIVSSCSEPYGVYLPASRAEVDNYRGQVRARALATLEQLGRLLDLAEQHEAMFIRSAGQRADKMRSRIRRCGFSGCRKELPTRERAYPKLKFCDVDCRRAEEARIRELGKAVSDIDLYRHNEEGEE